jgi:hypothetical protein
VRVKLDQAAVAKNWQARGFSCDLWVDPPYTLRPAIGEEILIPRPHKSYGAQHRRHDCTMAVRI